MTSSMASQGGLKVGPLYSFINEITTFFMITKKRAKISSLNFLCIGIMSLWLQLYRYIFMTSLMTSPGPLYSFINEITTFFMITKKRAKISSLNFLCIGIMSLWLQLYRYIFMTLLMTSPGPLYSFINEITTFFMITKKRAKISSLNFLCIGIMSLWLQLYSYIFMTSLMTSPGNKIGQILKLIYLRHYLS